MNEARHGSSPPNSPKGSAQALPGERDSASKVDDSAKNKWGLTRGEPSLRSDQPSVANEPEGAHTKADLSRSWRAPDSCEPDVLALVERIQPPFPRIIGPPL